MEESHCHWPCACSVSEQINRDLVLASLSPCSDGKKMSKSLKNYPDPNVIIDKYGADATRCVSMLSP